MPILESTGIADRAFCASFLVFSGVNSVRRKLEESGEYKALLMRLRDPEAPAQLLREIREALFTQREPGFLHPMDIAVFASMLALQERGLYDPGQWQPMLETYSEELHYGHYRPKPPEIVT